MLFTAVLAFSKIDGNNVCTLTRVPCFIFNFVAVMKYTNFTLYFPRACFM